MDLKLIDYFRDVLSFVYRAKQISADKFDWVGIYFKQSYFTHNNTDTDLILGPYLGEATDHTRIPINKGLCGLALSEERIVNIADVTQDTRHIACSLSTRSELIIPIADKTGQYIAELDIDSNKLNAFSKELEDQLKELCREFPLLC